LVESEHLGVLYAIVGVCAGTDHFAARVNNHGSYVRIRRGESNALPGQVQSLAEENFVGVMV